MGAWTPKRRAKQLRTAPTKRRPNAVEGLRHDVDRLKARTAEATELRMRLEITERAGSTVRAELAEERRRREEAEREREGCAASSKRSSMRENQP